MAPEIQEVDYLDATQILLTFLKSKGVCFFDSSDPDSTHSQWSICAIHPSKYHSIHEKHLWTPSLKESINSCFHSPKQYVPLSTSKNAKPQDVVLPFIGGWVGVVSYEAASFFEDFCHIDFTQSDVPKMIWAYYPAALLLHHSSETAFWVTQASFRCENAEFTLENALAWAERNKRQYGSFSCQVAQPDINKERYRAAISTVQEHIRNGDIYQANFTYPVSARYTGDLGDVYDGLRQNSPAPFSVFFDGQFSQDSQHIQICGASPEEFVCVEGRHIRTRPIKGTIARVKNNNTSDFRTNSTAKYHDTSADEAQKEKLRSSEKNNAELLMITDLERNDLGRMCKRGSVTVSQLNSVETYSHLHHLVSAVEGELENEFDVESIFSTLFPGGSITGAPKIRATEILAKLEDRPRNIYTGVMGYVSAQRCHFNIAIRSLYAQNGTLAYHVGGGIVADSEWEDEWEESILKGKAIAESLKKWL